MTIQDLPVPAAAGRFYELIAGEGVILKDSGWVAFAEQAGRAVLNTQTLALMDLLTISDSNFNGLVKIKGEVPDGCPVKADRGLKIQGPTGACQIESGGDIEIHSMAGKTSGTIICRGDLRVRFLNQANVFCYGNVIVAKKIHRQADEQET